MIKCIDLISFFIDNYTGVSRSKLSAFMFLIISNILYCGTLYYIYSIVYEHHKSQYIQTAQRLVDTFEDNTNNILRYADNYLLDMRLIFQRRYSIDDLKEYLNIIKFDRAVIGMVNLFDETGTDVYTTLGDGPHQYVYKDYDYFIFHKENQNDDLFIAPLQMGKISKKIYFRISRRIYKPDGTFWGLINVGIDPRSISKFYEKISIGRNSVISLINIRTQSILARYPYPENWNPGPGDYQRAKIWDLMNVNSDQGIYETVGFIDKINRIYFYKSVKKYNLIINIGISEKDLLDDELYEIRISLLVIALKALIVSILSTIIIFKLRVIQDLLHKTKTTNTD